MLNFPLNGCAKARLPSPGSHGNLGISARLVRAPFPRYRGHIPPMNAEQAISEDDFAAL